MALEGHAAVADFLGAASPDEIKFGANMSTLTFHIGRSIGATLGPGDEIVVTTLDHEANVSTWRAMAADRGVTVRTVDIHDDDVTLDLEDLESKLSSKTKLVAVGYASNAVGTVNPVREIVARAHEVGALTYVDAVAYAPHGPIDVQALDTDFLVCSAYKWFGPHLGALYGKAESSIACRRSRCGPPMTGSRRARPRSNRSPATLAATDYLRDVGRSYGDVAGAPGAGYASERRRELVAGMVAIRDYERELVARLIGGLEHIAGVTIHGITDRDRFALAGADRLDLDRRRPSARGGRGAGRQGIFTWDGDFYATGLIERLGKAESGGVLRLGLVHYNTAAEVDRTLDALAGLALSRGPAPSSPRAGARPAHPGGTLHARSPSPDPPDRPRRRHRTHCRRLQQRRCHAVPGRQLGRLCRAKRRGAVRGAVRCARQRRRRPHRPSLRSALFRRSTSKP